ncbi:hypothetical protein N9A28_01365 [Sulfurimonas sp.]|nr:hypothetical protein [Sulfurimonas sp.]
MELKDVILSTLAEMEDTNQTKDIDTTLPLDSSIAEEKKSPLKAPQRETREVVEAEVEVYEDEKIGDEVLFLKSMRERLLVLFEGFQAPNNTNIEAKVDMTLNFLEYVLVSIDTRVQEIDKGNK